MIRFPGVAAEAVVTPVFFPIPEAAYLEKSVKILLGGIRDPSSFGYLPIMRIFAIQQKQNGFQVSQVKILLSRKRNWD